MPRQRFPKTDKQDDLANTFWPKALGAASFYSFSCFVLTAWSGNHKILVLARYGQMPGQIFILSVQKSIH